MLLYHGSSEIIEKPALSAGRKNNDFGAGFYCTENIEAAKEWTCCRRADGYANKYELDIEGLKILDLTSPKYTILHELALLVKNRFFPIYFPITLEACDYILEHFYVDTTEYDAVTGVKADDSYFDFFTGFLKNEITLEKLIWSVPCDSFTRQTALVSEKAFDRLKFLGAEKASWEKYYIMRQQRDFGARYAYIDRRFRVKGLFILDILREEIKPNDPRLSDMKILIERS